MGRGRSKKIEIPEIPPPPDEEDDPVVEVPDPPLRKRKSKTKIEVPPPPEDVTDEVLETQGKPIPRQSEVEYPPGEDWRRDGKRFDISLQDAKELNKYQSQEETDSLSDAQDIANGIAFDHGRVVIVWDRKVHGICFRAEPNATEEEPSKKKK